MKGLCECPITVACHVDDEFIVESNVDLFYSRIQNVIAKILIMLVT